MAKLQNAEKALEATRAGTNAALAT